MLILSPMLLAAFFALALLYSYDSYFFDGYYSNAARKLFQQICNTFCF